jgi:hypothetical protein
MAVVRLERDALAIEPATKPRRHPPWPGHASRHGDADQSGWGSRFQRAAQGGEVTRGRPSGQDPPAAPWPEEIDRAIERADDFVFVLSPSALASGHCRRELEHATRHGKRVVPLVHRPVDREAAPPALVETQWIQADTGEFLETTVSTLVDALEIDLEWRRTHTRLLIRAPEWEWVDEDSRSLCAAATSAFCQPSSGCPAPVWAKEHPGWERQGAC